MLCVGQAETKTLNQNAIDKQKIKSNGYAYLSGKKNKALRKT